MGLMDDIGNLARQFAGGTASESDVHAGYDQAARSVPPASLATALSHTFQSDQTPPFEQMVAALFQNSTPEQKAGLLKQLAAALGPGALASLGAGAAVAPAGGAVTTQQAQQVTPQQVQDLAQQAAAKNPSIVDAAASFYAQHPTLVKTIGAGALALLMSRLSASRR
jgi:hypothetical protein